MSAEYLKAFGEEHPNCRLIIALSDEKPRMMNGVGTCPIMDFLKRLWKGKIILP